MSLVKRLTAMSAGLAFVVVAAACGSGSSPGTPPGSESAGSPTTAAVEAMPGGTGSADAGAAIPTETGPANLSMSPVTIGLIGTISSPGAPAPSTFRVAEVAVRYINDHLGGLAGHPVVLKTCNTTGDQQQTRLCAQQFANDPSIQLVAQGLGNEYSQDIYPILHSSGLFSALWESFTPADATTQDAVTYVPGSAETVKSMEVYGHDVLKAKSYAVVGLNIPVGQRSFSNFKNLAAAKGADAKGVLLNPAEADFTGPFTAAGATSQDAIVALIGLSQCIQLANTVSQLGITKPVLAPSACWDPALVKGAGSKVSGWHLPLLYAPANLPEGANPEVDFYNRVMAQYGERDSANLYGANGMFSEMISIWNAAHAAGASAGVTDKGSWQKILTSYTGPVLLGPRSVSCPGPADAPAVCSFEATVYTLSQGNQPYPTNPVRINAK